MAASHGRFLWYELATTDVAAAKAFYTNVVGWDADDASAPGMDYILFSAGKATVSGLTNLPEEARKSGATPAWFGYVGVDDVDAAADRARQLGGRVLIPPSDIPNVSRFSVIADPQMATLALVKWRKAREQPAGLDAPGGVGWHELFVADGDKALAFYSALFGWQKVDADDGAANAHRLFSAGGQTIGNISNMPDTAPEPFWLYYFNVGDIDAAAKRVKAGGGQILLGPADVADGSRIIHCSDPQGAMFALVGKRKYQGPGYFPRITSRDPSGARFG